MDYNHVKIRILRKIEGAAVRKCYNITLKEYYEIVGESRPPSAFYSPHMLICLQKCISNHETKQSTLEILLTFNSLFLIFLIVFFCIAFYGILLHEFCSVLRCDIFGIGLF